MRTSSNLSRAIQQFHFVYPTFGNLFFDGFVLEHAVFHLWWVTSKRDCWTATRQGKLARTQSEQQCSTHFEEILVWMILNLALFIFIFRPVFENAFGICTLGSCSGRPGIVKLGALGFSSFELPTGKALF